MAFCRWLSRTTGRASHAAHRGPVGIRLPRGHATRRSGTATWTPISRSFANLADATIRDLAYDAGGREPAGPGAARRTASTTARWSRPTSAATGRTPGACYDMHGNVGSGRAPRYRPYPYRDDDGRNERCAGRPRRGARRLLVRPPGRCRSAFRLSYPAVAAGLQRRLPGGDRGRGRRDPLSPAANDGLPQAGVAGCVSGPWPRWRCGLLSHSARSGVARLGVSPTARHRTPRAVAATGRGAAAGTGGEYLSPRRWPWGLWPGAIYVAEPTGSRVLGARPSSRETVARLIPVPIVRTGSSSRRWRASLLTDRRRRGGQGPHHRRPRRAVTLSIAVGHTPSARRSSEGSAALHLQPPRRRRSPQSTCTSNREDARVAVSREPVAAVLSADGRRLFVANQLPAGPPPPATWPPRSR